MHIEGDLARELDRAAGRIEQAWPDAPRLGAEIAARFSTYTRDTVERTMTAGDSGRVFVITGDIPAMWLRDSSAQLWPLLPFMAASAQARELVQGVLRSQFAFICHDPYANAFNDGPTGAAYHPGDLDSDPHLWERKYEIDSLAFPVDLAHRTWHLIGHVIRPSEFFTPTLHEAILAIVRTWRLEQRHDASAYRFVRAGMPPTETLARDGRGTPVAHTGMTWQGFRPSDDACTYGYNIPAQLFAARALRQIADLAVLGFSDSALAAEAQHLRLEILDGVARHGLYEGAELSPGRVTDGRIHGEPGAHLVYEVDGLGGALFMDDANLPSLLGLPLLGDLRVSDPIYQNTRRRVLSTANPHFVSGPAAAGVGSPHTPPGHVWPIALAVQGLTTTDQAEKRRLLHLLIDTDGGTGWMHESFDAGDPSTFTREWFSWANMMFCELALDAAGLL
ncbi:glycoside hydrolase family 125 protein [Pseudactinotalea sp. HY158]|uniref:glycoside hydrolase family 125 protein n=1 Tax=Pseudactinotalea sp. HY158 TaxID=2654547 RepID=UPI001E2F066D|nr:glycoside hydrolase family 125 protein [Pseudactinotalea sp. HY158]